jgi:hypothetical protein
MPLQPTTHCFVGLRRVPLPDQHLGTRLRRYRHHDEEDIRRSLPRLPRSRYSLLLFREREWDSQVQLQFSAEDYANYPGYDLDLNELRLVQLEGREPVWMTEYEKVGLQSPRARHAETDLTSVGVDPSQGPGSELLRYVGSSATALVYNED